jgi:hypothetical protein
MTQKWIFLNFVCACGMLALVFLPAGSALAQDDQPDCGRAAFAAAVNNTGSMLTMLNESNKKIFQEKLLKLKTRRGWSDQDYLTQAAQFVRDEQIADYDAKAAALVAKISQPGGGSDVPDAARCAMLEDLKTITGLLIANTAAKWGYMHGKLDKAMTPPSMEARMGP